MARAVFVAECKRLRRGTTWACPPVFFNAEYPFSGAVTADTSCPFAEQVRAAYLAQSTRYVPVNIIAYSPVTNQGYVMTCVPGTVVNGNGKIVQAMRCTGGNDAVVDLWSY